MKTLGKSRAIATILAIVLLSSLLSIPTHAAGNVNQPWTNDDTCGAITCTLRAWSDLYYVVQNSVTFTSVVSSDTQGHNCQGCWSIQFNSGNDATNDQYNQQTNYAVQYQFIIVITA